MVSRKTRERKTLKVMIMFMATSILTLIFVVCMTNFMDRFRGGSEEITPEINVDNEENIEEEEEELPQITEIDFQPTIDTWISSISGNKGVVIYDLDANKIVGNYNENKKFATASLYKLFVVYEGYRRLENGTWSADNMVGYTGRTILQCLDLAIRESNSPCAETLWAMIGHDTINNIIDTDFGFANFAVESLSATPLEIMQMMKIYYEHNDIANEKLISTMQDSFLNQPIITYNWRQGLPSGFSEAVKVYNKVGWNYDGNIRAWTIYDDAAILDFTDHNRHFIVVVMTNKVSPKAIRDFGTQIEYLVTSKY